MAFSNQAPVTRNLWVANDKDDVFTDNSRQAGIIFHCADIFVQGV